MERKRLRAILIGLVLVIVVLVGGWKLYVVLRPPVYYPSVGGYGGDYAFSSGLSAGPSLFRSFRGAENAKMELAEAAPSVASQSPVGPDNRLIIKTGHMSVVVQDVRLAIKALSEFAEKNGGFVVSSNVYETQDEEAVSGSITVRIPSQKFEESKAVVKDNSVEVKSEGVTGQDVTEEYVDLDAQLRNLKATEEQFLVILKKAETISDTLSVWRELNGIRGNIEQIEGKMKYLRESAALSTLTVNYSTDEDELPIIDSGEKWRPKVILKNALRSLVKFAKNVVSVLIWIGIYAPVWLIILLVLWVVIRWYKRRKHNV